jgi:Fe-S cluster biogenesis protein NfuA
MLDQKSQIHSGIAEAKVEASAAERLDELMSRIDRLPANSARELVTDCIRGLLDLYGEGLSRILELAENAETDGKSFRDALLRDKTVRALLLIHDLHPHDLESRLLEALEGLRPYMESHGGNIELVSIENQTARLRFTGACKGCPSSAVTMELNVRRAVEEACPDLAGIEVESETPNESSAAKFKECGDLVEAGT